MASGRSFLFGAIYAGAMVPLWLAVFAGDVSLPTAFAPRDWHVHEMLFGYVERGDRRLSADGGAELDRPASDPGWSARDPVRRLACREIGREFSGLIGWQIALAIDIAFLLLLAGAAAREIVAGRKWNNLKVVGIITLLAVGNIAFHVEAHSVVWRSIPRDLASPSWSRWFA